jgi:hypothetical protein
MPYTREQLTTYIEQMKLRLAESASPWMKAEVRKAIKLAESELAKLDVQEHVDTLFPMPEENQ